MSRPKVLLERTSTIGFIGLGAMGNHMLNNLICRSPFKRFAVFDINDATVNGVIARHKSENPSAQILKCASPADVATKASYIMSMVPTSKHVQEVYTGRNSVLTALQNLDAESRSHTLCLDQSTIEQSVSKAVALEMRKVGANMMDAPVSGGVVGAEKGTLAIMVGGDEQSFERALPVLSSMARKVTHCGDLGTGLAAKISNNLLLGITMLGLSEATLLGTTLGVKPQVLADIINNSTGECWSSKVNHPDPEVKVGDALPPAHRNYAGGFVTKLAHKDLGLAVSAAKDAKVPLELGKRCEEVYRALANSQEWGGRDFSGVLQALKDTTALKASL
ncbi:3-hydroxyisobutyrate dehydrogenase, mitochondrial [Cyphellophora attinorum]|uniref:3-hydroxyisobutyrate dehydrogenase n=1 Tax=Cyphellophora attinorum TaxID=1664694 RepID=A0A0N0NLS3_9EURO|nr:3-hydroxyisobutyrate dehydrogenase, mitochondrial [Phialophora attinorum]KPI39369.1 3-hydroxyisobutyrate dehydrogenase, mitochondrial [Phialophora attinorum]